MKQVKIIKLPKREYGICVVENTDTGKKAKFTFDQYGITGFISGNWFTDMFDERNNQFSKNETLIMNKIAKHKQIV
jgi:hypothetical protein